MAKIKIIESPREVWWATTHQGRLEVNGKEVEYRFHENNNECELFVFEEGLGWTDSPVDLNTYDILYDLLVELAIDDLDGVGDEFEFDLTE